MQCAKLPELSAHTSLIYEWAVKYSEIGWLMVPLWGLSIDGYCECHLRHKCLTPGSHIAREGLGSAYKGPTNRPLVIRNWLNLLPGCSLGVLTGRASDLIVAELPRDIAPFDDTLHDKSNHCSRHYYAYGDGPKFLGDGKSLIVHSDGDFIPIYPPSQNSIFSYTWNDWSCPIMDYDKSNFSNIYDIRHSREISHETAPDPDICESSYDVDLARDFIRITSPRGGHMHVCDGVLYSWSRSSGIWMPLAPNDVKMKIQHEFHGKKYKKSSAKGCYSTATLNITPHKRDSIYDALLHEQSIYVNDFFSDAPLGIAFENGWVSGRDFSVLPHSPDQKCRVKLNCDFDRNAKCHEFIKCIDSYFEEDEDKREKIEAIQEFFGACLFGRATSFQRALLLYGPKANNGKSTLVEILGTALFPDEHKSYVSSDQWGIDYYRASLAKSVVNFCGEVGKISFKEFQIFKDIITGKESMARQVRANPYPFAPLAGHVLEANKLPAADDDSNGFWRRLLIVTFNKQIENALPTDYFVKNIMLEQKGIINWAIHGAIRLFERGHYVIPKSHDTAIETWKRNSNNVLDFFVSHCDKSNIALKSEDMLYDIYKRYCCSSGESISRRKDFRETLVAYGVKKRLKRNGHLYYACTLRKRVREVT